MWFKSKFTIQAVVAISFCLIGGTTPANADLGDQLALLLAEDGMYGDEFGWSVAISGNIAFIGAPQDNLNNFNSGSAYLFDATTGVQIAKLLPEDGSAFDRFGRSIAISGTIVVIGAVGDDDNGTSSGSAYLFDISDPANPKQIAKLLPDDGAAGDLFGFSVTINGDTVIVGAMLDDEACPGDPNCDSGSAYIFNISDPANPTQIAKFLPKDGAEDDQFGYALAIGGPPGEEVAIVGVRRDDDNGEDSGSVYLFDIKDPANPVWFTKLLPNDGAAGDFFGFSVEISGEIAIIGALGDQDNGMYSGSAYLFNAATGQQIAKLLPNDGAPFEQFGFSVAICNNTAVIGAIGSHAQGTDFGSAYIFDTTTGKQLFKILVKEGSKVKRLGWSVGISGPPGKEFAIVGAPYDNYNGSDSGSAYLFNAGTPGKCPWDLHGDGFVGYGDLLILLGWWCCDPNGPPDFNGDGIVNTIDLLELLANWGPCP